MSRCNKVQTLKFVEKGCANSHFSLEKNELSNHHFSTPKMTLTNSSCFFVCSLWFTFWCFFFPFIFDFVLCCFCWDIALINCIWLLACKLCPFLLFTSLILNKLLDVSECITSCRLYDSFLVNCNRNYYNLYYSDMQFSNCVIFTKDIIQ